MTSKTTTKNDKLDVDGATAAAAAAAATATATTTAAAASTQTSFDQGLDKISPKEYFIQIPVIVIAMRWGGSGGGFPCLPPCCPPNKVTKRVSFWAGGKPLHFFWPY
jgi:hypothetical protein